MQDFEKLGVFYMGRSYDQQAGKAGTDLLLYDSKDLVTHGVCVGMTGSGKTGLCLVLLEEAAIDGIPALVIDPKGDLGNMLLTFPDLRGEDFAPWINEEEARNKGLSVEDFAAKQAETWKAGLADWGQDGDRIRRLRQSADFAIYTPGSNAGLPLAVIKSFAAPESAILDDAELFRDCVNGTVTSLLGLLGIQADPVQSREHILLTVILGHAWKDGRDLELGDLIQLLQNPPVDRVGVVDLESFFPSKDRFALAMKLNALLASPGFEAWMKGEPLDIRSLLYTPEGKPRISIISIAHLGDAERMFIVSLLLNQALGWVRSQSGTTSLRALIYMDEIFGYFPPVANPPSKQPLLTLLKQARAFGVGVMLATQNPVDLDYKGLANCGTWFIGRLQTERDKARVLEGLEGAALGVGQKFDRGRMEQTLAGLGNRVFLMNNVHEDHPVTFQVRWSMSYLRGPLTRDQIKKLMESRTKVSPKQVASTAKPASNQRPVLPPEVPQFFLPVREVGSDGATLNYEPRLFGQGKVYFSDAKLGLDQEEEVMMLAPLETGTVGVKWPDAEATDLTDADLEKNPEEGASFAPLPSGFGKAKALDTIKKAFGDHLFRTCQVQLMRIASLKAVSQPGESERDFRARLQHSSREERDARTEKLRTKYAPKLAALQERIRKSEQAVTREAEQATQSKFQAALSFGSTILGAFMSRKTLSAGNISKAATAVKSAGRTMKESSDVGRAKENVGSLQQQLAELEAKFQEEVGNLEGQVDSLAEELETVVVKPKKTNVTVQLVALVWAPVWKQAEA